MQENHWTKEALEFYHENNIKLIGPHTQEI